MVARRKEDGCFKRTPLEKGGNESDVGNRAIGPRATADSSEGSKASFVPSLVLGPRQHLWWALHLFPLQAQRVQKPDVRQRPSVQVSLRRFIADKRQTAKRESLTSDLVSLSDNRDDHCLFWKLTSNQSL